MKNRNTRGFPEKRFLQNAAVDCWKARNELKEELVGAPGFEPGTSRTPSVRATRLRYAPTAAAGHFGRLHPSRRYHLPSSNVKKLRSASRKSSSSLRFS